MEQYCGWRYWEKCWIKGTSDGISGQHIGKHWYPSKQPQNYQGTGKERRNFIWRDVFFGTTCHLGQDRRRRQYRKNWCTGTRGGIWESYQPNKLEEMQSSIWSGDVVWGKPPDTWCMMQWDREIVTESHSNNNISVDGMPRHILDVRSVKGLILEDKVEDRQPENGALKGHNKGPKGICNCHGDCVIIMYNPEIRGGWYKERQS